MVLMARNLVHPLLHSSWLVAFDYSNPTHNEKPFFTARHDRYFMQGRDWMEMKKEVRKSLRSKLWKQLKRRSLHGDKKTIIMANLINTVTKIANSNRKRKPPKWKIKEPSVRETRITNSILFWDKKNELLSSRLLRCHHRSSNQST